MQLPQLTACGEEAELGTLPGQGLVVSGQGGE